MKAKWTRTISGILVLAAILLFGICATNVGKAYARYQDTTTAEIEFKVRTEGLLEISCPATIAEDTLWEETETGTCQVTFTVSSQNNTSDVWYYLSIASVPGYEDGASISLLVENANGIKRTYKGVATAFATDSLLYQQMGAGYEYRFYDAFGEELCWNLESGGSPQEFTVELAEAITPNLMEVIVTQTQQP